MVYQALARDQKKARQQGPTIVWVDEAGFYLLAGVVRTYAPRGQTPILYVPLTRDHLAVISGITAQGPLLLAVQEVAFTGGAVVRLLQHVLGQIAGPLVIIWDGAPIHRDKAVKAFLGAGGAGRLELEQLPGYAPDLNPDEGVWNYLKHVELRNVSCHDLEDLRHALWLAIARLRHKPAVIRGFIKECGY
ncbi:MAG TPA: transposase [Chloroflexia bacterium]|nr:transposase [Chloroflexia bacterium]